MDIRTTIERAKAKDSHALETLYRMYYHKMLGLCIKITREDEDTAKDLVHDAFVLAFSSLCSLNSPERFGEWLSTIVRNIALKYVERKKKTVFTPIDEACKHVIDANTSSDAEVNLNDLTELIEQLPDGYGKVFRLYAIEGFSHKEIADILGIEAHSSSSQLSRAKAMLRNLIKQRFIAVMLLLILAIPLYLFISLEKSLERQEQEIPKGSRGKEKEANRDSRSIECKTSLKHPANKLFVADSSADETSDTSHVSVSLSVEIPTTPQITAENKPDSINHISEKETADGSTPLLTLADDRHPAEGMKKNKKWQMLAAGSLGPALAQNIHRLLSTGKAENIGSAIPTYPEEVTTWEDYSKYLHATDNGNMTEDTLALMEIADHNHGRIMEQEQHSRPVTFGISISKPLSGKWSLETGLQYSILKSKSTMGSNGYYIGKDQKIHYLGIPLRLSYCLAEHRHLSAYSSAGLSLNIPVYGKVSGKYVVAHTSAYTESWHITPPVQWSTSFSIGLQYHLFPKIKLYAEPTLHWHIPNNSSTHTIWTEHPVMFSVPFGIRVVW